jgi:hypothetical protein
LAYGQTKQENNGKIGPNPNPLFPPTFKRPKKPKYLERHPAAENKRKSMNLQRKCPKTKSSKRTPEADTIFGAEKEDKKNLLKKGKIHHGI